jgi:putative oxidoreductase
MMWTYAAGKSVPLPGLAVGGSGLLAVFGGVSLVLGYEPRYGLLLLVAFLLGVTLNMHDFWAIRHPLLAATSR